MCKCMSLFWPGDYFSLPFPSFLFPAAFSLYERSEESAKFFAAAAAVAKTFPEGEISVLRTDSLSGSYVPGP